ncbi:membrane protein [Desulfocucumis palustris]|uniref:Membrane protein n=1 Tax=Desulfocucumis palustris TaxID=1898651 RepID=A0A2L2XHA0_9FIRM|nr:YdcF family protein [Desulfocucumis palustris]GBF35585.1 membrane protein [Desulfocucumis palustris]
MKFNRHKIFIPAAALLISALFLFVVFAGKLLVLDQKPVKSDVVIVLGGDSGERVERAAALYKAGYAPYMIVSGGELYHSITQAEVMAEHAEELGVPREALIPEARSESTYDNAAFSKEIILQRGFKSAIVVTSNYHMQRSRFIFQRVFKNSGVNLTYCSAREPRFDPDRWWSNNKSIMFTITEYIKFAGYVLGKNI